MDDTTKESSHEPSSNADGTANGFKQEPHDIKTEHVASERKRSRCQEKNRRAQARFRERQKAKATETDQKVAGLEETVQRLQREKASLQTHALSLQAQLQQAAQQPAAAPHSLAQPAPTPLNGLVPASYSQVLADTRKTGSGAFEVVLPTAPPMEWDSYVVFYKEQIHKMAPLLAPAQAQPAGPAAQTCERLLTELSESNRAIFHRHPSLRDKVHTQPLVEASEEPRMQPDVALWRQVTAALRMTPAQKQHARDLHSYYWKRMRDIMAERQRLSLAMVVRPVAASAARLLCSLSCEIMVHSSDLIFPMQSTCELPPDVVQSPAAAQCKLWHQNQDIACKHSQALETITALNKNIAEETLAQIEVGHGLFCKVLTPLQACSAYVGLYPFFPDKLAILSCVLELDESEDAVRSLVTELVGS